jgi:hypothetical protein
MLLKLQMSWSQKDSFHHHESIRIKN